MFKYIQLPVKILRKRRSAAFERALQIYREEQARRENVRTYLKISLIFIFHLHVIQLKNEDQVGELLQKFEACGKAAKILYEFEKCLYKTNILSEARSFDPIPCLERNLFELAADPNLTSGVFYAMTITVTDGNNSKKIKTHNFRSIYHKSDF